MKKFAFLLGASLFLASTAHAEGFYLGGSIGFGDATLRSDIEFVNPDDKLFLVKGVAGYRPNKFFAVEGTIIGATNDDWDWDADGDTDVSFFAKVGGYVGESEVGDDFFFFGNNNRDEDESGLVWGAGAFFNFGSHKQFTIRVEYEEFDTDALDDFWAVSSGFQYNF
jgi:hypothetical protein